MARESKISKAYRILEGYDGDNAHILYLKRLHEGSMLILTEDGFDTKYVLDNHDYKPVVLNRTYPISSIFGEELRENHNLDFTPSKLKIISVIGEMGKSYHVWAQYRKSVKPSLMYVRRTYLLTPLMTIDYESIDIDFSPYNERLSLYGRRLKPHQETAVKFLVANKKCILADSMGLGKTASAIVASMASGCKRILVITTASLKSTWKRELSYFVDDEDIAIVSGSKWDMTTRKFTVINYDIVKNYYEIAYKNEYKDEEIIGNDVKITTIRVPVLVKDKKTGEMVNKKVKSRKKSEITKSLLSSPLFTSDFDCVIVDEAQKLSNNTSTRYKVIQDFLSKSQIKHVFLVTGTPLTNTPMNLYHILRLINADVTDDYEFYVRRYCDGKEMKRNGEWNRWLSRYETRHGVSWDVMSPTEKRGAAAYISENASTMVIPQGSSNLDELRERIKHVYIRRLSSDIPGMVNKHIETRQYDLNATQKAEYGRLWDEYVKAQIENGDNSNEEYRQLVEGTLVRQFLAREMVDNTISVVDDYLEDGEKVIIVCNFTNEIEAFKEHYGKQAVTYDGKMLPKQKDKAEREFMENPKIKVFIGQEVAASVGLSLTSSHVMVFNSYSWSENDNRQMQDRIYRITQKEDALCIYQLFTDSVSQDMFDKVMRKGLIMDETIKAERDK